MMRESNSSFTEKQKPIFTGGMVHLTLKKQSDYIALACKTQNEHRNELKQHLHLYIHLYVATSKENKASLMYT